MITIIDASFQRGWDAYDHLIDDSKAHDLIGRTYTRRSDMLRALDRIPGPPISILYRMPDGTIRRRYLSGSPTVHTVDELD